MTQRDEEAHETVDTSASGRPGASGMSINPEEAVALMALNAELQRRLEDAQDRIVQLAAEARGFEALAHEDELTGAGVSPVILQRIASWVERAERVVVFVGSTHAADLAQGDDADAATAADWTRFTRADSLREEPSAFERFWAERKRRLASGQPSPVHRLLVELAAMKPSTTLVTERVDGVLAKAGAHHVIELYGNVFRSRCLGCGQVTGVAGLRACPDCGSTQRVPDICLVGEPVNARLLGQAELAAKGADLVLVIDGDRSHYPGSSLLEKARVRGARVVVLGSTDAHRTTCADVASDAPAAMVLRDLLLRLKDAAADAAPRHELSNDGFAALCFLSGHGADHQGRSLQQMLRWSDRQIERTSTATQWQFPLLTKSRICPEAPVPTEADFAVLAKDDKVRAGLRLAFERMLAHWGFEWSHGHVRRSTAWQAGFERWHQLDSIHSLRISRVLGALSLCGLRTEAEAFLTTLEHEMPRTAAPATTGPLKYWRGAVQRLSL